MNMVDEGTRRPVLGPPFWQTLAEKGESLALVEADEGRSWSYRALAHCAAGVADAFQRTNRGVLFVFGENDLGGIVGYLAGLLAGHAVYLVSTPFQHALTTDLLARYRPELIWTRSTLAEVSLGHEYECTSGLYGYRSFVRKVRDAPEPHRDLALLLSTSASTGNPKTVRVSARALTASAYQVVEALRITSEDHAVTSLPFCHVYGLSVVNSHLAAGARLLVQKRSVVDPAFWSERSRSRWTTLAGVTATYELMRERDVSADALRGVRKLLHAGDRLPPQMFSWLYSRFSETEARIFLMYGQTEATGRISVLPPERLPANCASVGQVIPNGRLQISSEQEIVFFGPNVMMGYAGTRDDLSRGSEWAHGLHTGDLGYIDSQGLLYVTGRKDRSCKVFGQRIALEEIESLLRDVCPVAALSSGENILIAFEGTESEIRSRVIQLSRIFRIPPQAFLLRRVNALPRTATGKICYRALDGGFA